MRQQVLDRDPVIDLRQVVAQHGPGRLVEGEFPALDQRHQREGGETFRAARQAEPGFGCVAELVATVGQPERPLAGTIAIIDPNDTGEPVLGCRSGDDVVDRFHAVDRSEARLTWH